MAPTREPRRGELIKEGRGVTNCEPNDDCVEPEPVFDVRLAALQEIDYVVGNESTLGPAETARLRGILRAALSTAGSRSRRGCVSEILEFQCRDCNKVIRLSRENLTRMRRAAELRWPGVRVVFEIDPDALPDVDLTGECTAEQITRMVKAYASQASPDGYGGGPRM